MATNEKTVKKEFNTLKTRKERLNFNYETVVEKMKKCNDQTKLKEYNDILKSYRNKMYKKDRVKLRLKV